MEGCWYPIPSLDTIMRAADKGWNKGADRQSFSVSGFLRRYPDVFLNRDGLHELPSSIDQLNILPLVKRTKTRPCIFFLVGRRCFSDHRRALHPEEGNRCLETSVRPVRQRYPRRQSSPCNHVDNPDLSHYRLPGTISTFDPRGGGSTASGPSPATFCFPEAVQTAAIGTFCGPGTGWSVCRSSGRRLPSASGGQVRPGRVLWVVRLLQYAAAALHRPPGLAITNRLLARRCHGDGNGRFP